MFRVLVYLTKEPFVIIVKIRSYVRIRANKYELIIQMQSKYYNKAITGKSTAVFIRSVRLQKAKELIHTTDKTISAIAYEVGFNGPSWFSRAFKEEFGYAPSEISK